MGKIDNKNQSEKKELKGWEKSLFYLKEIKKQISNSSTAFPGVESNLIPSDSLKNKGVLD